jgi:hypothetical protein
VRHLLWLIEKAVQQHPGVVLEQASVPAISRVVAPAVRELRELWAVRAAPAAEFMEAKEKEDAALITALEREIVSLRETLANFEVGWAERHTRDVEVNAEVMRLRNVVNEWAGE